MIDGLSNSFEFVDWTSPVNWGHPLNSGLVAWWLAVPNRMGWGSNKWRDLCKRNDGTLTGMDPATDWVGGERFALDFDGSNDYVTVTDTGNAAFGLSLPFSISYWLGPFSTTSNLVTGPEKNTNSGFSCQINGGRIQCNVGGAALGTNVLQSVTGFNNSLWHRVVFRIVGADASSVWVDGVNRTDTANDSGTPNYGTNTPLYIGSRAGSFGFAGRIADVRIGRLLSEAEIALDYQEARTGYPGLLNRIWTPRYAPQEAAVTGSSWYYELNQQLACQQQEGY